MKFLWDYFVNNRVQMIKYACVGFSAFLTDFSVLYILTDFVHLHYLVSATIAFLFASLVNYSANRVWTFRSNGSKTKQIPVFLLVVGSGLLLNNYIMYVSVEHFGLWYMYAKIIATTLVTIWNFFGNKYFTFKIK